MSEWKTTLLGDLAEINPESISASKYSGEIEYIDIASVDAGLFNGYTTFDFTEAPSRARRKIQSGDIIYSTVRPNLEGYWYAKGCPQNAIASTGFAVIRAKRQSASRFIYYLVTEQSFVDYLSMVARVFGCRRNTCPIIEEHQSGTGNIIQQQTY